MDRDDIVAAAHKHEAGFSRATLASRVLVEMAVCSSPLGSGRRPGLAEFDELLAAVAHLIALAYDSDAMRAGLSEPSIRVFPNGEFFGSGKFYESVLVPYHSGHFAERFEERIKKYPDLYEAPQRVGRPVKEVFDSRIVRGTVRVKSLLSLRHLQWPLALLRSTRMLDVRCTLPQENWGKMVWVPAHPLVWVLGKGSRETVSEKNTC
jgi:hypothetical protein